MTVRSLKVQNYNNQGKLIIIIRFERLKTKMKRQERKETVSSKMKLFPAKRGYLQPADLLGMTEWALPDSPH